MLLWIIVLCTNICSISGNFFLTSIFIYITSAVLLVSIAAINHCCMYKHMQCCRYLLLLSIVVICANICSIIGICCCYQSFLHVQSSAVLLVSVFDINHCYMYKYNKYCRYLMLLSIIVICTNICIIAGFYCCYQ